MQLLKKGMWFREEGYRRENGRVCVGKLKMGAGERAHKQMVNGRLDYISQTRISQNGVNINTKDDFR